MTKALQSKLPTVLSFQTGCNEPSLGSEVCCSTCFKENLKLKKKKSKVKNYYFKIVDKADGLKTKLAMLLGCFLHDWQWVLITVVIARLNIVTCNY